MSLYFQIKYTFFLFININTEYAIHSMVHNIDVYFSLLII